MSNQRRWDGLTRMTCPEGSEGSKDARYTISKHEIYGILRLEIDLYSHEKNLPNKELLMKELLDLLDRHTK